MNIIRSCWDRNPSIRLSFEQIARDLRKQRTERSSQGISPPAGDSPKPPPILTQWQYPCHPHHSPDILPQPLPDGAPPTPSLDSTTLTHASHSMSESGYNGSALGLDIGNGGAGSVVTATVEAGSAGLPVAGPERSDSISTSTDTMTSEASIYYQNALASGYLSDLDPNDMAAKYRNERRYRMLLQHDYHTIRTYCIDSNYVINCHLVDQSPSRSGSHLMSNSVQSASYQNRMAVLRRSSMHLTLPQHQREKRTSYRCCRVTARFIRVINVRTSAMLRCVASIVSKGYFPPRTYSPSDTIYP
jgi:hypothetical protein